MKRLLLFGTDKALARFYYAAHLRCRAATHDYRNNNVACYSVTEEEYPALLALAEKLKLNHETVQPENRYRRTKRLIEETYARGERFKTDDLIQLTGYSRPTLGHIMAKLVQFGHVESHGRTAGHYYCRPPLTGAGAPDQETGQFPEGIREPEDPERRTT